MRLGRLRFGCAPVVGAVCVTGLALWGMASTGRGARRRRPLIKYNGNSRDYWEHPPADWFMGDETAQQHGTHPYPGQPLPTPHDELVGLVKDNIKLLPGFHIEVLADQLDCARQMVFGSRQHALCRLLDRPRVRAEEAGRQVGGEDHHQGAASTDRHRLSTTATSTSPTSTRSIATRISPTISTTRRARSSTATSRRTPRTAGSTWLRIRRRRAGSTFRSARPATSA